MAPYQLSVLVVSKFDNISLKVTTLWRYKTMLIIIIIIIRWQQRLVTKFNTIIIIITQSINQSINFQCG